MPTSLSFSSKIIPGASKHILSDRHYSMPLDAVTKNDIPQGKRHITRKKKGVRKNKVQPIIAKQKT